MSTFAGLWAGNIYGTNTGKVFLELQAEGGRLTGLARLNDDSLGVVVYKVSGTEDDDVELECIPERVPAGIEAEPAHIKGKLGSDGTVSGKWETESGTGGRKSRIC